jgi:hypothetical protein
MPDMLSRSAFKPRLSRTRTQKRPAEKQCEGFLQWLRGRNCAAEHVGGCSGKMTAAHVDYAGDKGVATKVADRFAIPLCAHHAQLQHNIGWDSFDLMVWKKLGGGLEIARQYFQAWPGRIAWLRKLADGK